MHTHSNLIFFKGEHFGKVTLQEFAVWGLFVELHDMPPELKAMAAPTQNNTPTVPVGAETAPTQSTQVTPVDSVDFAMLATRQKLIEAFGTFTGMDASWFKNLKDTPELLAARKVKGQGGRGHIAEPLFCPLEVMKWLISPKRRKSKTRTINPETAWRMLETHFTKVYNANSIADPRKD